MIYPETEEAPSYLCPRQLCMSKVRFATPFKTVSAKAFPDKHNSQCRKPKNSLISPLPPQILSEEIVVLD